MEIKWENPNEKAIGEDDIYKYLEENKQHKNIEFLEFFGTKIIIDINNSARGLEEELKDRFEIEFYILEL